MEVIDAVLIGSGNRKPERIRARPNSPNFIGCPMGILQLVLYCIYRKSHDEAEKFHDIDQENGLKV
ncbi:hypothetical protein E2562_016338, partial [Oryza meyeriana var. granulata]